MSFTHGANDVANAMGPFAAVYSIWQDGEISSSVDVQEWILVIGAHHYHSVLLVLMPRHTCRTCFCPMTLSNLHVSPCRHSWCTLWHSCCMLRII